MKTSHIVTGLGAVLLAVPAALGQVFLKGGLALDIPDGDLSGVASVQQVTTTGTLVTDVDVTFTLAGDSAFNGDFYAYIEHDGIAAVLLNSVGRTGSDSLGYADAGFTAVRFDDQAAEDVHTYRLTLAPVGFGALTGTWQPDGRTALPGTALDTHARTALLSGFNGVNPNGSWTLFVADSSAGGTAQLTSWSLAITAVPEPLELGGFTAAGLAAWAVWRNRHRAKNAR